jgi:hypothetical protein
MNSSIAFGLSAMLAGHLSEKALIRMMQERIDEFNNTPEEEEEGRKLAYGKVQAACHLILTKEVLKDKGGDPMELTREFERFQKRQELFNPNLQ